MRIRTQLSLFTSLVVVASVMMVGWLAYRMQNDLINRDLEASRSREISGLAEVCRLALTMDNPIFMKNYIRYIRVLKESSADIVFAFFVGEDRRVLYHTNQRFERGTFPQWEKEKPLNTRDSFTPLYINGRRRGTSVIGFSNALGDILRRQTRDLMLIEIVRAGTLVALPAILLAIFFSSQITRPLQSLMDGCEKIRKGDFSAEINLRRQNELGELARHFNRMSSQLAAVDQLKDQIIANVSHDLRGPLHGIKINIEYLLFEDAEKEKILPQHRSTLMTIMQETIRLNQYIANHLDAAKIKAGRMEYRLEATNLKEMAAGMLSIFEAVAKKRRLALTLDMPQPAPWILADPEQFEHVLVNLVSNALKFTPPDGRITLEARKAGANVRISVADTGSGIPAEELPLLFTRFSQADKARQREKKISGTGLGLHIVKQSVEAMGGSVEIESSIGRGTRVTVIMPAANNVI